MSLLVSSPRPVLRAWLLLLALSSSFLPRLAAEALEPALQAKVDARLPELRAWAADPVIVKAVLAANTQKPAEHAALTQEKWKSLGLLDPLVRSFSRNEAGTFLKSHKAEWLGEAFLSAADGTKVAFLSKPTNWSHLGRAKHDEPMKGQVWQGALEVDESSGLQQVQVALPVLSEGRPVGVLTVGLVLGKL